MLGLINWGQDVVPRLAFKLCRHIEQHGFEEMCKSNVRSGTM